MRRFFATMLVLVMVIGGTLITVSASTAVTMEFVPRTEKGTVFWLDVCCDGEIGAAVFALSFDDGVVEYRGVSGNSGASVQAAEQDGLLRIAYAHPDGNSGTLLRLTFNALTSAETSFTLSTEQAVDADVRCLTGVPDYCLRADVGRQKVISSGAVKSTGKKQKSTEASEKTSRGSSGKSAKSTKSSASGIADGDEEADDQAVPVQGVSNREGERWFLVGVCAAVGVILIAALAFLIGKRAGLKSEPQEAEYPVEDEACHDEEFDDDNSDIE